MVQAIFLVSVADALFTVVFSLLELSDDGGRLEWLARRWEYFL